MFYQSFRASFGVTINVFPSTLLHVPEPSTAPPSQGHAIGASPVVQLHVSKAMEARCHRLGGSHLRLGSLQAEVSRIGVAIAYSEGHFALGLFDHGNALVKEMSSVALQVERFHLLIRAGVERTLFSVPLTANMRQFLGDGQFVPLSTVGDFTNAVSSIVRSLTKRDLYAQMGIDADTLKSVTVSVCMPDFHDDSTVEAVKANAMN